MTRKAKGPRTVRARWGGTYVDAIQSGTNEKGEDWPGDGGYQVACVRRKRDKKSTVGRLSWLGGEWVFTPTGGKS